MPKLLPSDNDKRDKAFFELVSAKMEENKELKYAFLAQYYVGCSDTTLRKWAKEVSDAPTFKVIKFAKALGLTKEEVIDAIWK